MGEPVIATDWLVKEAAEIREKAAQRLSEWIADSKTSASGTAVAECLPVFTVDAAKLTDLTVSKVVEAMSFTGRWHVQVVKDGKPFGYARVTETDAGMKVESWTQDVLKDDVDNAITKADQSIGDEDFAAVLLEVAPFHLRALVLVPEDVGSLKVILIGAADASLMQSQGKSLSAAKFLQGIKAASAVQGIIPDK